MYLIYMCSCVNAKARGQLWRHNFLLPPSCGSTGSNSGRQDYMASVLPSDHFASPYLASFLMYWLQVELLNFLKQYKLLSCMKTKAWECSVYNTVHIVVFLLGCSQRSYGSREQRRQAHSLAGSLWRCLDFRQMTAAPYPPSLSSLHA